MVQVYLSTDNLLKLRALKKIQNSLSFCLSGTSVALYNGIIIKTMPCQAMPRLSNRGKKPGKGEIL